MKRKFPFATMARPISETPILFGEDAERFLNAMDNVQPITPEELHDAQEAYEWMKSVATFPM